MHCYDKQRTDCEGGLGDIVTLFSFWFRKRSACYD
jgi:hypothetical protein